MVRILLTIGILLLFGTIIIDASERRSKHKADQIIRDICERLYDDDLYSDGNRKWYILCQEWIEKKAQKLYEVVQDENIMNEEHMTHIFQPRRGRGGGGGRFSGGARFSGGTRSFTSGSSSSSRSGSRSSSAIARFRNTRTGATISRPSGWQWSRSRLIFLPLSTRAFHRSSSSSNRFTTPAASSLTYYYCTSNSNASVEIQCSSIDGDSQCCEDETTQQVFCCGGRISEDFVQDVNQAAQILARIFYTLAAMTLCIHIFMRRFR